MTAPHKGFMMLLFTVTLLSASARQAVSATPDFRTEDQLKFTLPLPDNATNAFSFLLFSTEGDIANAKVQVRQVKTPDGELLPLEAATAALESATVGPMGIKVSLTPDTKFFAAPGEYRVVLFFQGNDGTPNLSTTVVINRPAADINLQELKDQTIALTRFFPFLPASKDFVFYVRESTGKASLNNFKVVGQNIYFKDTKELAPGEVTATPVQTEQAPAGINIPPGGARTLKVSIGKMSYAGTFDTRLLVTSPSFSGEKIIPIKVTVQDFVLFPLLAIALGVAGGYFTRRLVSVDRPRDQNNFEILRLQNEVERFRELVTKPASVDTIQSLLAQLRMAKDNNRAGDFTVVRAELHKIQEKLTEFRRAQVEAEGQVQTALNSLRNQVDLCEQSDRLNDDETRDLHSIKDKLVDLDRHLRLGMVDDAQIKIENVQELLEDLRGQKFSNFFMMLKAELAKLNLSGEPAAKADTLKAEVQALLNNKDFDKVQIKLGELKSLIEEQKVATRPLGARGNEDELDMVLPQVPTDVAPARPISYIDVGTPSEERLAGTNINFTVVDLEQIIVPGDRLNWFFGEVGSIDTESPTASHTYQDSGRFQVRVEIVRNGALLKAFYQWITVSPGQLEQARASVLDNIIRNEKILSAVALVLAIISGVIFLYIDKVFGSLLDYLMAILWGFGIDNSIKGFAAVLGKISSTEAQG